MTLEPPPIAGEQQEPPKAAPQQHESISSIPDHREDPPPRVSAATCLSCGAPLSRLDEPCLLCKRSRLITRLVLAGFIAVTMGLALLMLLLVFMKASGESWPSLPRIWMASDLGSFVRGFGRTAEREDARVVQPSVVSVRLDPAKAEAFYSRGRALLSQRLYEQAGQEFEEAIRLNPKDARLFFNRGLVRAQQRDYRGAISDYTEAIQLEPQYAAALDNRGNAWDELGEHERAIQDFSEAIRIDPRNSFAFFNRGLARENSGDYDLAVADYDEALRLNPQFGQAARNRERAMLRLRQQPSTGATGGEVDGWVGVLREDAVVMPLFLRSNARWISPWPPITGEETDDSESARSEPLSKIPSGWLGGQKAAPVAWNFWKPGGAPAQLRARSVQRIRSHCELGWGLKTDYEDISESNAVVESRGLVTTGSLSLIPSTEIAENSPLWNRIESEIQSLLLGGGPDSSGAKGSLKWASATTLPDGRIIYHFSGEKVAKPASSAEVECQNVRVVSGSIFQEGGQYSVVEPRVIETDCDYKEAQSVHPFGAIQVGGKIYFVNEIHGYEDSSITLQELTHDSFRTLFTVSGGAC